jgi:hypothetical protein
MDRGGTFLPGIVAGVVAVLKCGGGAQIHR